MAGARAVKMLDRLVNLPGNANDPAVTDFIEEFHNLELGRPSPDTGVRKVMKTPREEVIRLRGLYRLFWSSIGGSGSLKANIFLDQLSPRHIAMKSMLSGKVPLEEALEHTLYPYTDYRNSGLELDWKTGRFRVAARGPIDWLTHAVFQHRNRLRICANCSKHFVAQPKETLCSEVCKQDRGRGRRRKWWKENRSSEALSRG
jgi:hypothetical protein